jgi:integrase/recombinase XerD
MSILDGATGDPRGIRELGAKHVEWIRIKNNSPATARNREHHLMRFARWCEERQLTLAHEITKPIIDRYQRFLFYYRKENGLPLSARSQILLLVGVKMFFKWCVRNNHLLYNPASEIELPRKPRQLPHVQAQRRPRPGDP